MSKIKLPRVSKSSLYTTGDDQKWTYQYTWEDWNAVLNNPSSDWYCDYVALYLFLLDYFIEHPEYIPYLAGKDLSSCMKARQVQVEGSSYLYKYEYLYNFLGTKLGFSELINFITQYSDVFDIIVAKDIGGKLYVSEVDIVVDLTVVFDGKNEGSYIKKDEVYDCRLAVTFDGNDFKGLGDFTLNTESFKLSKCGERHFCNTTALVKEQSFDKGTLTISIARPPEAEAELEAMLANEKAKNANEEEEMAEKAANKGEAEIIIAKHRNGPVGTIKLLFQSNITKFKNPIKTDVF